MSRLIWYCLLPALVLSSPAASQETISLWSSLAGIPERDLPTLTMYEPDSTRNIGTAVIICPGGSYRGLARHEGEDYALFLSSHGIRAFVLRYRLGPVYDYRTIPSDARRAVQFVRHNAARWGIDPAKVGIMGSSAGGHLAATAMTLFEPGNPSSPDPVEHVSSRPDFGILCYPVISMGPMGHAISREQFLGPDPSQELIERFSLERRVTPDTPPAFLWHTAGDTIVPVWNSLAFAEALSAHNVPFALHVYERGRHGIGLGAKPPFTTPHPWTRNLLLWLDEHGWVRSSAQTR